MVVRIHHNRRLWTRLDSLPHGTLGGQRELAAALRAQRRGKGERDNPDRPEIQPFQHHETPMHVTHVYIPVAVPLVPVTIVVPRCS